MDSPTKAGGWKNAANWVVAGLGLLGLVATAVVRVLQG